MAKHSQTMIAGLRTIWVRGPPGLRIQTWGTPSTIAGRGLPARFYGMLIVVTLYAGKVSVSDEPLTAVVPMDCGVIGSPAVFCVEAEVAVI